MITRYLQVLSDIYGFLIQDGRIFAPEYSTIPIHYDEKYFFEFGEKPYGTWVKFSAICRSPGKRGATFEVSVMRAAPLEDFPSIRVVRKNEYILVRHFYFVLCIRFTGLLISFRKH